MTTAATSAVQPTTNDATSDRTPKGIKLSKIISTLKKTGSATDTAKILGCSRQLIYKRLDNQGIEMEQFLDYSDDKALSHEILQYRIASGLTSDDIKKMQGGSKVLAICQLDDKIQAHRGKSDTGNSVSIVLNLACQSHNKVIDVTPGKVVDKPVDNT